MDNKNNKGIKIGQGITIDTDDGRFASVVQNISLDNNIIQTGLLSNSGSIYMPEKGTRLIGICIDDNCCYQFFGVVESYIKEENLSLMNIKIKGNIDRVQRRKGFRVTTSIPIDIKIYELYDINSIEKFTTIIPVDISENGIGIRLEGLIETNRYIDCILNIDEHRFEIRYRVVRCMKDNDKYIVGLEMIDKDEKIINTIRKFAFAQEMKKM